MPAAVAARLEGNDIRLRQFIDIIGHDDIIAMYRADKMVRDVTSQGERDAHLRRVLCISNSSKGQYCQQTEDEL